MPSSAHEVREGDPEYGVREWIPVPRDGYAIPAGNDTVIKPSAVMAGLDPAIHVFATLWSQGVYPRAKPGDDAMRASVMLSLCS